MLDAKDLQLIGVEMGKVLEHNIVPQLDAIHEEIKGVKGEIVGIKGEIVGIKAVMVTKDYLDEKMGLLEGKLIAQDRKLEKKTDVLVDALVERHVLSASDVEHLEQARVFPRITQ